MQINEKFREEMLRGHFQGFLECLIKLMNQLFMNFN